MTETAGTDAPGDATPAAALGRRIRDERSARGFSLQEFALLTGLTAPMLSALERGDEHASLSALFAAAEALDVPPGSLFSAPPAAAASVPPAHSAPAPAARVATEVAPHGYVPLEVPELWEPPQASAPARAAAPVHAPAAPVPPVSAPAQPSPAMRRPTGPTPRTFADLRVGVLADRTFASLPEFAVAAVVEAGHPISVVASIFRVPSWRLESWIDTGVAAPRAPKQAQRTAWGR
jgi:transcriptional regulator with XRE-family HTH domain